MSADVERIRERHCPAAALYPGDPVAGHYCSAGGQRYPCYGIRLADEAAALAGRAERLEAAMRAVYEAGIRTPGNMAAALVEPHWKALHAEVPPRAAGEGE